jgi:hypothetical protein
MDGSKSSLLEAALFYAGLGYPVFPCVPGGKPPITEHGCLDATTDEAQIKEWWVRHSNSNIGLATDGLLVVDVDGPDNPWLEEFSDRLPDCPVALTPGGGRHFIFRQPDGKNWKCTTGRLAEKVDTRANGGYIVVPPSVIKGRQYQWQRYLRVGPRALPEPPGWLEVHLDGGSGLFDPPSLQETTQMATSGAPTAAQGEPAAPGGNTIPSGHRNATLARLGGNMRRVGMTEREILVALTQANADRCQPPLKDREVERIASSVARYEPDQVAVAVAENHWAQDAEEEPPKNVPAKGKENPGSIPDDLLRIPGFVSEVMDHCLQTAPYPNPILAFAGALALQGTLAGRKVRDPDDNRTNLYLLGLAYAGAGKDRPRKLNKEILNAVGLPGHTGDGFASGEGIQDQLFNEPCKLFQTDEIDGILQAINKSREARHESILTTLLTMFSSANSVFIMRSKAGRDLSGSIDQPCLSVFGTAIPEHYYTALSERMLTNGFFARMIVLECNERGVGQSPGILSVPERVLQTAQWWADFRPGRGNLQSWHPEPSIVPQTQEATRILAESRREIEANYRQAEQAGDATRTAVWSRVDEHIRKLALVYALSEDCQAATIGSDAVTWARQFVMHQTRRMLFMSQSHVAANPFHAECLKVLQRLREAPDGELPHSTLLKRMKTDTKTLQSVIATLEQMGDIESVVNSTAGRPLRMYRLMNP